MFIPNKTYLAMKTGIFGVISVLLLIIAAQGIFYTVQANKTKTQIEQLTVHIDSLEMKHSTAKLTSDVTKLQRTMTVTKNKVDVLVTVHCATVPYDVNQRLSKLCLH